MAAIDQLLQASISSHEAADAGQLTLFGGDDKAAGVDIHLPANASAMVTKRMLLEWEKELVGVYVSSHPLQQMTVDLMNVVTHASVDITETRASGPGRRGGAGRGAAVHDQEGAIQDGLLPAGGICRDRSMSPVFPQQFNDQRDQWKQDKIVIVARSTHTAG